MGKKIEIEDKYAGITKALIKRHITITTMESCTSGLIASYLTDTEGASEIFKGAFVTYSNEAKKKQGVPSVIIDEYGVYSLKTATAMAHAAGEAYDADISIGVTGTMGNVDPANADSQPGEVFFAIDYRGSLTTRRLNIEPQKTRHEYKLCVADLIADELYRLLDL